MSKQLVATIAESVIAQVSDRGGRNGGSPIGTGAQPNHGQNHGWHDGGQHPAICPPAPVMPQPHGGCWEPRNVPSFYGADDNGGHYNAYDTAYPGAQWGQGTEILY